VILVLASKQGLCRSQGWGWLRYWFVLGLFILSLVLVGCTPDPTHQPASPEGVVHLTLWQGVNPPANREVLRSLVEDFNRTHPQIQVESLYVGQPDQQLPKILAAVVGNATPDLLWFNPTLTGQLVELNAICPLEDWLNASAVRQQIDPVLFETMQFREHIWSLPFGTNNVGVFYRPEMFRAAGITQTPQTWGQLRQVAHQLTQDTNGDGRVDQHGMLLGLGKGEFTVFTWLPFLWSAGAEVIQGDPTHPKGADPTIIQPGTMAALQFWQDLIEDGSAILSLPERGFELDQFLAGKVAMQLSGPWTLRQLRQTGVDFGVFPIPTAQQPATALGGENLFVFKTNPERERAALTFAEYVLSEGFQTRWALQTGYLPVNLKSRQSPAYQKFIVEQPAVAVFLKQMAVARSRPIFPGYARVSESLGRALEATLLGQSTPAEALEASQRRLELIFDPSP